MKLSRATVTLILLAVLTVAVGVVTNVATDQMPDRMEPYRWVAWPVLGALALVFVVVTVTQARDKPSEPPGGREPLQVEVTVAREPEEKPPPLMTKPPEPYFAQPYPLQANFTGRVRERKMLTGWLAGDDHPVLVMVAIGGMGKSAVTWAWLQKDVLWLPLPGVPADAAEGCRLAEGPRPSASKSNRPAPAAQHRAG